jgi:uncharacterized protein YecA (UPF0149 family)
MNDKDILKFANDYFTDIEKQEFEELVLEIIKKARADETSKFQQYMKEYLEDARKEGIEQGRRQGFELGKKEGIFIGKKNQAEGKPLVDYFKKRGEWIEEGRREVLEEIEKRFWKERLEAKWYWVIPTGDFDSIKQKAIK